jgi:hypothetical protein
MKQRFLRPDDDLDDGDELILRGGDLDPSIIRRDAQRMFDIYGTYGISGVRSPRRHDRRAGAAGAAGAVPALHGHDGADDPTPGLQLEPTGRNHRHYTLTLRSLDEDVAVLVSADHHVWMNPYHEA